MNQNKRFKQIHEFLEKKSDYGYYYDDRYVAPLKRRSLNCSDEIVPGSKKRTSRIQQLMHKKIEIKPGAFQEVSNIVSEMHNLMKEEHMALVDCDEREADHFLDTFVDFNHFKYHESADGKQYLSIDPIIGNKYEE